MCDRNTVLQQCSGTGIRNTVLVLGSELPTIQSAASVCCAEIGQERPSNGTGTVFRYRVREHCTWQGMKKLRG